MDHQFGMVEWERFSHQAACRVAHAAMPHQQPPNLPTVIQPPVPLPAEVWQQHYRNNEAALDLFRVQHYLRLQTAWQQRTYRPQAIGFSRQPLSEPASAPQCVLAARSTAPLPQQEPPVATDVSALDELPTAAPTAAPAVVQTASLMAAPMAAPMAAVPLAAPEPQTKQPPSSRGFQFRGENTLLVSILEGALKNGTLREQFIKERNAFVTKTFHGRTMLRILQIPALFDAISANKDMLSRRELAVFTDFVAKRKSKHTARSDLL